MHTHTPIQTSIQAHLHIHADTNIHTDIHIHADQIFAGIYILVIFADNMLTHPETCIHANIHS